MRKTSSRLANEVLWKLAQGGAPPPPAGPPQGGGGAPPDQGMPPEQQQQLLQAFAQSGLPLPPEVAQIMMQMLQEGQQQPGGPPQG